jgi:WD40 repeat protein
MLRPPTLILIALLVWSLAPAREALAQGGEPSREPILRIETGMHTTAITRIGVDAANQYLVTASHDKTVRVWELPTGRLLRVIRPPLGAGDEGKLYAVAISPDGSTIAAAGFTLPDGLQVSIYLFARESGRLIRRLGGLPNVVLHLVYSPDGRYLAATLAGKNGIRVFSTTADAPTSEDRDYGDDSYSADFDRAGRLATTSWDGFIRLYATGRDGSLRLIAKRSAAGGQRPFAVKFSPDGTRRAIVNDLNGVVNELSSAENGAIVFAASTGNQFSLENREWGNGAFTKAIVDGLQGRADYAGKGRITVNMLDLFISETVKELTHGRQTPTTAKPQTVPDFPIAFSR